MITCHAIAQVKEQFIGDPLDIEMFEATKWIIDEEPESLLPNVVELASFHSPSSGHIRKFYILYL
jgi:hypothetical protein